MSPKNQKPYKYYIVILFFLTLTSSLFSQNKLKIEKFVLSNGLTVYLSENHETKGVFGDVVVNAGSADEEKGFTGLAHYLEHLLFNGTEKMGTTNWQKEKESYDKIIILYDQLKNTKNSEEIKSILQQITQYSQEQSKYVIFGEFNKLLNSFGSVNVNASTSYDRVNYFNLFPSSEIDKWLDIYANRFQNPVFRNFQTELENVYEEYNLRELNEQSLLQNELFKNIYGSHAYGRPVIGEQEDIKFPSLSKMTEFYKKHYVPSNMALILVGDFNSLEIKEKIKATFGLLPKENYTYKRKEFVEEFKSSSFKRDINAAQYPFIFQTHTYYGKDFKTNLILKICAKILDNASNTGLINRAIINGDIIGGGVFTFELKDMNKLFIQAYPKFDLSQRKPENLNSVLYPIIQDILKKMSDGGFEDWLLTSIKEEEEKRHLLSIESNASLAFMIEDLFIKQYDVDLLENYISAVKSITREDIMNVVKKYITSNSQTLLCFEGDVKYPKKFEKPVVAKVDRKEDISLSDYAKKFYSIDSKSIDYTFVDFEKDISEKKLTDKVKLYCTKNKVNDIFTMTIKFGIGTHKIPTLKYSVSLLNRAGIRGSFKSNELKKELALLGCTVEYEVDASYFYIFLNGKEERLPEIASLITKVLLIPDLDDKQRDAVIGGELSNRYIEKKASFFKEAALREYLLYQDSSTFINRLLDKDVYFLTTDNLTSDIANAIKYEAEVHYIGSKNEDQVFNILLENMAWSSDRISTESPYYRNTKTYSQNTAFILGDVKTDKATVFISSQSPLLYNIKQQPFNNAFNAYYNGGFNGIVMQEVRELRGLAYSANIGMYGNPYSNKYNLTLQGTIPTQSDKVLEVVGLVDTVLINNMPIKEDRIDNLKSYLLASAYLRYPNFRSLSEYIVSARRLGYNTDPLKEHINVYKTIKMQDLIGTYNDNIKNKPFGIAIFADLTKKDVKELKTTLQVKNISVNDVFRN